MRFLHAAIAGLCTATLWGAAPATAEEPYFKGKQLTLLIGSAAGGPTDIEGRLFAKYLGRHIDGQPSVIVQNKAGAGGLIGPTYLGEVAPRDGTVLGYFSGTAWNYVNNPQHWRVDYKTYEFVAYQAGTTIDFMRTDVPPGMKVPTDIAKAQGLVVAGLSVDNPKDIRTRLALDMLGVPFKYVTGYRTSMPARLALQRGEVHIFSESPPSYRAVIEPTLVKSGEVMPVWYDSEDATGAGPTPKSMAGLDIPSFSQLYIKLKGKQPSGKLWDAFRSIQEVNSTLQRVITLPPGASAVAAKELRAAVTRLNDDKEFAAESLKVIGFEPDYESGPDIAARMRAMLVASPEVRAFTADYIKQAQKK
jgi:tripartite-type tricarboxylate transporter receptor subunit TctC